jgi:hypothetical protein
LLAYLDYIYSNYGNAGEVMRFLGMLNVLMLRKKQVPASSARGR